MCTVQPYWILTKIIEKAGKKQNFSLCLWVWLRTFDSSFEDEKHIAFPNSHPILMHYQCEEFFCEISLVSQGKLFFFHVFLFQVEKQKKCFWNCWLGPSNNPKQQIKLQLTSWQYSLINYLDKEGWNFVCHKPVFIQSPYHGLHNLWSPLPKHIFFPEKTRIWLEKSGF